jgi:hypothetical protein
VCLCADENCYRVFCKLPDKKYDGIIYKPRAENEKLKETCTDPVALGDIEVYEWLYGGATCAPKEELAAHKAKYFPDIKFRTVQEYLESSLQMDKA